MDGSNCCIEHAPTGPETTSDEAEMTPVTAGYGACSVSGCHCQAYSGQDYTCVNCGHNYSMHW